MANHSNIKFGGKAVIFSEDRQSVIVLNDETGEDEQLSIEEFAEMYGLDIEDLVDSPAPSEGGNSEDQEGSDEPEKSSEELQPTPKTRYEFGRWRGLLTIKNFVKHHERHEMLAALDEQPALESQRAYYSALLELTYAVGDVCWAESAIANDEQGTFPVQKMLKDYGLKDAASLDSTVGFFRVRRDELYEEFAIWSRSQGFLPISKKDKDKIIIFISDGGNRRWIRAKAKKLLEADGELIDMGNLMRERYKIIKKRLERDNPEDV